MENLKDILPRVYKNLEIKKSIYDFIKELENNKMVNKRENIADYVYIDYVIERLKRILENE